jgi:hypothetical protein
MSGTEWYLLGGITGTVLSELPSWVRRVRRVRDPQAEWDRAVKASSAARAELGARSGHPARRLI